MRDEYDFRGARPNPYVRQIPRRPVTIRMEVTTIAYFQALAAELSLPYQTLINLYLRDCAVNRRRLTMRWPKRK
jgi:hypothetical protein